MATKPLTLSEFLQIYKDKVQAYAPEFTDFSIGSMHDIVSGAFAASMNELTELTVSEFNKTFFDSAAGDDLENLAVDHFGENFARPEAIKATGIITFSRPDTNAGNVTINAGTVVKTEKNSEGEEISFVTTELITLTGLSIDANIEASIAGSSGNLLPNTLVVLETALTDSSVVVNNALAMAGGEDEQGDDEYRETIKNLIESLAGATKAAIQGAVLALPNVGFASLITLEKAVIEWDIGGAATIGDYFRIPYPVLYVADENGNSSPSLVSDVEQAIIPIKACGVNVDVVGATGIVLNWSASLTLNAGGPNYSELQGDLTKILDTMTEYINQKIEIGQDFSRTGANNYILSIWGPSGTNDLTSFSTVTPSGNVSTDADEKLIAGTMEII